MGSYTTIRAVPYVQYPYQYEIEEKEVRVCPNNHEVKDHYKFCPECSKQIGIRRVQHKHELHIDEIIQEEEVFWYLQVPDKLLEYIYTILIWGMTILNVTRIK